MGKSKRTFNNKSKKTKIILGTFAMLFIVIFILYKNTNKMQYKDIKLPDSELGINEEMVTKEDERNITNILLLGVDNEEDASDSIMVLSINKDKSSLKLTSIMRDSYIFFGDDKVNKLNYAYHYGGPELSVKTINENYDLDIRDYVKVDFNGLDNIIDGLGGIEMDITSEELPIINGLKKGGKQTLNGAQAVIYSRIRKVGNNDYGRTDRQRKVMQEILRKLNSVPVTQYRKLISSLSEYVETSISTTELVGMASKSSGFKNSRMEELRIPLDGTHKDEYINNLFYLKWNKEKNVQGIHDFIYGE
ncbi:cell envelope-like transcriptional attenuator domain-containing protein [Clostridium putrefaciens]|uniref:Cell envelope-like transcriptional attenuator domain-containing protein n=1 Tax=Clostridium putrefaciens TaxID=99675 RepID=A0A381J667_9CLOT|nr:LCP family protein [Clostridium putrefaciens]SUY45829.1 cell envelope-like transcriptional attenuator domain-containing protein [Clostridium putrefaciens]